MASDAAVERLSVQAMPEGTCLQCGRIEATQEQWDSLPGGARPDLCWSGPECYESASTFRVDREVNRILDALPDMLREDSAAGEALRGRLEFRLDRIISPRSWASQVLSADGEVTSDGHIEFETFLMDVRRRP